MAPTQRTDKGEATFVSPYTGEQFTSQFAYNDHLNRWPGIAAENGLALDGTPLAPEPPKPPTEPGPTGPESPERPEGTGPEPVVEPPTEPGPVEETPKPKKR